MKRWIVGCLCLWLGVASVQAEETVSAGSSVTLFELQDDTVQSVLLFYRYLGSSVFAQQPLQYQMGRWSVTFRGGQVRAPGLEYYVQIHYKNGQVATKPEKFPSYNPMRIDVTSATAAQIYLLDDAAEPGSFVFKVQQEMDADVRVWLDDTDVSDFVQRQGERWELQGLDGLLAGKPLLKITTAQGDVLAQRALDFTQPKPAKANDKELIVRGNASFNVGGQTESGSSSQSNVALSGNAHIEAEYQQGDFSSQFSGFDVNYQYQADPDLNLASGFLLTNRYKQHVLEIGDVSVSGTPLVLSGFARRGLQYKTEGEQQQFSLFNVRTATVEGWESGISFDNQQTYGVNWQNQLGQERTTKIQVSAVSGELQQPQSSNVASSNKKPQKGDSAGVQIETVLGGVNISAQLASSQFDPDSSDALSAKADSAYELKVSKNLYGLSTSLGFHRYGANYATIANPNFSNDRQGFDVSLGSQWQMLGWNGSVSTTRDNINNDTTRPVINSNNLGVSLNVVIEQWPTINVGLNMNEQHSTKEPTAADQLETSGQDWVLGLSDQIGRVNWSWSSSLGQLTNKLDSSKDSDTLNHALSVAYAGEQNQLSLNLTRNEATTTATLVSDLVSISANFPVFKPSIRLSTQLSLQNNTASDLSQDNQVAGGSMRIAWRLQDVFSQVTAAWANAQFALNWRYNETSDALNPANDQRDQRIMLEFSLGAPVSFEQRWQF